jgi:hypothetical protein
LPLDAQLVAHVVDDLVERRVVHMTDPREQVMLDLVVEPADQPSHH